MGDEEMASYTSDSKDASKKMRGFAPSKGRKKTDNKSKGFRTGHFPVFLCISKYKLFVLPEDKGKKKNLIELNDVLDWNLSEGLFSKG